MEYKQPQATVDVVLLTLVADKLNVVLLNRDAPPFQGRPALPGGYIHTETDSDSRATAHRVLEQKTGIRASYLEQLYTFSGPDRDPRGWSFSVTFYALVGADVLAQRKSEGVVLVPVDKLPELAFDHNEIVEFATKRIRDKSGYSTLPCYLLPKEFSWDELQKTYEKTTGVNRNARTFRRMIEDLDFLELLPNKFRTGNHRPAQLYRIRPERNLTLFDKTI
jgi:8-oxo-dGTP diphosphatase